MSGWYDEYGIKAYPAILQASDNPTIVGQLLYSGSYTDVHDTKNALVQELQDQEAHKAEKDKTNWMLGLKARKIRNLECTNPTAGYVMANNMIVTIEADAAQAATIHRYLNARYNKVKGNVPRPGFSNMRYIPDTSLLNTARGERDRVNMLKKHQQVLSSLELLSTDLIKYLDAPVPVDTEKETTDDPSEPQTTLRKELLGLPFPLTYTKPQTKRLFHSVDVATSGIFAGMSTWLTAYEDRSDKAAAFLRILPAWVETFHGPFALKKWLDHQIEPMEVEFHYDASGAWDGTWTTSDDKVNMDILNEDVGIKIDLEGLELVERDQRRILEVDNASHMTFQIGGSSVLASVPEDPDAEADDSPTGSQAPEAGG